MKNASDRALGAMSSQYNAYPLVLARLGWGCDEFDD